VRFSHCLPSLTKFNWLLSASTPSQVGFLNGLLSFPAPRPSSTSSWLGPAPSLLQQANLCSVIPLFLPPPRRDRRLNHRSLIARRGLGDVGHAHGFVGPWFLAVDGIVIVRRFRPQGELPSPPFSAPSVVPSFCGNTSSWHAVQRNGVSLTAVG